MAPAPSRLGQAQQRRQPLAVEPDDDLAVDDSDRGTRDIQALELRHRGRIVGDISRLERNPVLGEELLDPATEDSARLIENRDQPGHRTNLRGA